MRPSEQLKRGRLDLEGVDLSQPTAVSEHLFGKVLRVDKVAARAREPLALELENFVSRGAGISRPGSAAKTPCGPSGSPTRSSAASRLIAGTASREPLRLAAAERAGSVLRGPHAWRKKSLRQNSSPAESLRPLVDGDRPPRLSAGPAVGVN